MRISKRTAEKKAVQAKRPVKYTEKVLASLNAQASPKQGKENKSTGKVVPKKDKTAKVVKQSKAVTTTATTKTNKATPSSKQIAKKQTKTSSTNAKKPKPDASKPSTKTASVKPVEKVKELVTVTAKKGQAVLLQSKSSPTSKTDSKVTTEPKAKSKKAAKTSSESTASSINNKVQGEKKAAVAKGAVVEKKTKTSLVHSKVSKSEDGAAEDKNVASKTKAESKPVAKEKKEKKKAKDTTGSSASQTTTNNNNNNNNITSDVDAKATKTANKKRAKAAKTDNLDTKNDVDASEKPKKRVRKSKNALDDNDLYFKEYKHAYEDPNWDGNEDDAGSVASGVMEEDFCFKCGLSTLSADCWQNVIMCDRCDGEYHLHCLGLTVAPENDFVCHRCIEEQNHMEGMDFTVGERFKIPPKPAAGDEDECRIIYSPSRPLEAAWEECLKKGLMVVSEVFSYELMKKLTHGTIENRTKSGRIVDIWRGATEEVPRRLSSSAFHNVVDREGRYDLTLPEFVVEELKLNEILEPILSKLRSVMGTPLPQIRTHNVVFVPVGSHSQQWHTDDSMRKHKLHRYFTVLVHLNTLDNGCGGTEVWSDERQLSDLIRCRPGDALVFNGSLLHRGQANLGYSHRFFYYASFACGSDLNVGAM